MKKTVVLEIDSEIEPVNKLLLEIVKALTNAGLCVESVGFQQVQKITLPKKSQSNR